MLTRFCLLLLYQMVRKHCICNVPFDIMTIHIVITNDGKLVQYLNTTLSDIVI